MAKDDYFVIVYQMPAYLDQRLKHGEPMDGSIAAKRAAQSMHLARNEIAAEIQRVRKTVRDI